MKNYKYLTRKDVSDLIDIYKENCLEQFTDYASGTNALTARASATYLVKVLHNTINEEQEKAAKIKDKSL